MLTTCPHCHRNLPDVANDAGLSTLERGVFEIVRQANGITAREVSERLYIKYANGGPLTAANAVAVMRLRINRKLGTVGLRISSGHCAGRLWRLENV